MTNVEKIKKALKQFPESEWVGVIASNNTVQQSQSGRRYAIFAGESHPIIEGTFKEVMDEIDNHAWRQSVYDEAVKEADEC